MAQKDAWDREYRNPTFLTKDSEPQQDVVRFVHWLKKHEHYTLKGARVLDLGCGTGRNSFYFTEHDAVVSGIDISPQAIREAKAYAQEHDFGIDFREGSFGEKLPFEDGCFDVAIDITSSNSLSEAERVVYLAETHRVLKTNGYFCVKALCRDADHNAQHLLLTTPGKEKDTYVLPEVGITERVFSRTDFIHTYEPYFEILELQKKTSYTRMNNRVYKRNFWIAYMRNR